jgi:hypothetical protein
MLESIRIAFFKNALRALAAGQKRKRKLHNTSSAQTIGLLFDASSEKDQKIIRDYGKVLEKAGKKVQLLGFFQTKQLPENAGFDGFSLKETNWTRKPKSEKVDRFLNNQQDLLICFNPNALPALAWIALASNASMKIGLASNFTNDFDLQLEIPEQKGPQYFIEQMHFYLEKLS